MTYYELMNTLESIRISPRNSEYINKLNNTTLLVYNDIEPNIKEFIRGLPEWDLLPPNQFIKRNGGNEN